MMKKETDNFQSEEWFFRFSAEEVPWQRPVNGPLPQRLVSLLNLYLQYRPHLFQEKDPGTLFLNRNGGTLTAGTLQSLVGDITERHVGKRIPPIAFRDIFAYFWLTRSVEPKEDLYASLASIRWESVHGVRTRFDPQYQRLVRSKSNARKRAA